jgi:hypothetical protein
MPEAEVYFLLNTFANMAIARGPEDSDFILTVTLDLFRVETNIFFKRHYYFLCKNYRSDFQAKILKKCAVKLVEVFFPT